MDIAKLIRKQLREFYTIQNIDDVLEIDAQARRKEIAKTLIEE